MNKNKTLVILGAGGHGRVVEDCAESLGHYNDIIFLDDCFESTAAKLKKTLLGLLKTGNNTVTALTLSSLSVITKLEQAYYSS